MFAVVVVTYSAPAAVLDATLSAINATIDTTTVPVLLVDTGGISAPSDSSVEVLRVDNRGYGAAANAGFARARELGATRFVLLNDDVIVHPGWLATLDAELVGDVGAVQPKLLVAGSDRINSLGVELDETGAGRDIGFGRVDDGELASEPHDIDMFTGGAVLFSGAFLDATDGFDERFMLYYEDVDLALRGHELGWRYRLAPAAVVEHIGGLSTSAAPNRTRYLQERNRLWNAARHGTKAMLARAAWLSVRRLRHRPVGVHGRALVAGVAGMPLRRVERRRARRRRAD